MPQNHWYDKESNETHLRVRANVSRGEITYQIACKKDAPVMKNYSSILTFPSETPNQWLFPYYQVKPGCHSSDTTQCANITCGDQPDHPNWISCTPHGGKSITPDTKPLIHLIQILNHAISKNYKMIALLASLQIPYTLQNEWMEHSNGRDQSQTSHKWLLWWWCLLMFTEAQIVYWERGTICVVGTTPIWKRLRTKDYPWTPLLSW